MEGVTWEQFNASSVDSSQFVFVGKDSGDNDLFVGRAEFNGTLTPGYFATYEGGWIFIANDGEEHALNSFEYLVNTGDYDWVQASDGQVPPNAVPCGNSSDGETLFLGRCERDNLVMAGHIQPSKCFMLMPYNGQAHAYSIYEVLCKIT